MNIDFTHDVFSSEQIVLELKRFTKSAYKIEKIASTASELKYTGAMK
ncbi:MAG: hypothetical protein IJP48_09975 [Synergistaceae bacterium]|nr:hypothetical protein [Synergistaceae bacterium]